MNIDSKKERRLSNTVKPADMGLEEWQVALRQQQAEREHFVISEASQHFCPGEYSVRNHKSRSRYKVIYRGAYSPWNYCSCPDFRTSGLGTCKHVEGVKLWLRAEGKEACREEPAYTSVYVDYRGTRAIRIRIGQNSRREMEALAHIYFDHAHDLKAESFARFDTFLEKARAIDPSFRCYPDALEMVIEQRERLGRASLVERVCTDNALDKLLTTPLYPYQKEGVRFALRAGKAIIADEMGLGKTLQAICCAEIYLKEKMVESVLIVCPTSLKFQWRREIERFTGHAADDRVVLVEGYASRRLELYKATAPYKIVSYQSLANDIKQLDRLSTDLLIMDEVQRLKNWNTQLAQAVRRIDAHYSVLLSGTPLENKLDELCSIVQLADPYCLAPLYRFRHEHIITDPDTGKAIGYKNLNDIRQYTRERLIRRTKKSVRMQLPNRTDQYLLVPMTPQQSSRHEVLRAAVARLVQKWGRTHNLCEEERRRLLLMLGQMRMLSDSTFITDQDIENRHDVKVTEVMNILENALESADCKVVIFSEWERMTRLVALELDAHGIDYAYLNGNIPAHKRGELIDRFNGQKNCRVFLSTDAGSIGLNLQTANLIINLDLPWNPAILEQRIGRIYRIGQEMPVQVMNLVSKGSIEESMIERLRFKKSMFSGVLDGGEDTIFLSDDRFRGFMAELSSLMQQTDAITDEPVDRETEETITPATPAQSTDELLQQGAAFLNGLVRTLQSPEATKQLMDRIIQENAQTGETAIHIPIENRETVAQLFGLLGTLLK